MSAPRAGLRFAQSLRAQFQRQQLRFAQRRNYSAPAENPANVQAPPKAQAEGALAKLWNSPVGPKTVHFWAPIMKWGLVLAGAADFARPASQLSLSQNSALMATGLIWTRWCFVIKPRNLFLASVNFLLFLVGATQTSRVLSYRSSLEGGEGVAEVVDEEKQDLEKVVKDPASVKDAVAKGK